MVVALVDKLLQDTGEAVRAAALLSSNILLIIITLAVVAWAGRRSRNVKLEAIVGAR